ncbi:decarboxylating 6-phosphogluconate dehydrogenase [Patescibacteria group bacterium]|nr:decarboxylating 6-phosphogluconate dehydrogenase [Patescibacteria group bacterium]
MQIGFIGLGKMGKRMASKLLNEGHEVIVWNRTKETVQTFLSVNKKAKPADSIEDLILKLRKPKVIWVMLPAGEITENILTEILNYVEKGDIVIDGGNSNWKDTEKHYEKFTRNGIEFLGIGVSGGIIAADQGYPMMVGGSKKAYDLIRPILDSLAKPNGGHEYFGEGGAGHFVKMVHNAIEYGYMQSIGEGFEVLEKSEYNFNLEKIANLYRKNTLISGFMMDRTEEVLQKDPKLEKLTGVIGRASGETVWTIEEAKRMRVDLEIIESSLNYRLRSETDPKIQKSFTARMVSALRNAFGGHEIKTK